MAKVKAPLFGLEARGQLGGAIVYFPWKGIQAVREYVIPANPRTDVQQAQRGYMTAAMLAWHAINWTSNDVTAFRRWANIQEAVQTYVNVYIGAHIDTLVAENEWINCYNIAAANIADTTADCKCETVTDEGAVCHYGTTPQALINEEACTWAAGTATASLTGLTPSTKYYFQIINEDVGKGGSTGIFSFTTTA